MNSATFSAKDSDLTAANIADGVTVFGVTGTALTASSLSSCTHTGVGSNPTQGYYCSGSLIVTITDVDTTGANAFNPAYTTCAVACGAVPGATCYEMQLSDQDASQWDTCDCKTGSKTFNSNGDYYAGPCTN